MSSEHVDAFTDSLTGVATAHRTTVASFPETLAEAIEEPAVGTPLPFEGVSFEDAGVETEFSPGDLEAARTGVTPVTLGIEGYGSVAVPSDAAGSELVSLYTDRHVACLAASDVESGMAAAFERLEAVGAAGGSRVLATGPSATADMGTLIEGVHGPHEVHVVVLEDR